MEHIYDDEFGRLFARDLKNAGQATQPTPNDWAALAHRLDAAQPARAYWRGWPWLALLLLWALSSAGFGLYLRSLHQELALLRKAQPTTAIWSSDTIRHQLVLYDTLYRNTVYYTRAYPMATSEAPMLTGSPTDSLGGSYATTPASLKPAGLNTPVTSQPEPGRKSSAAAPAIEGHVPASSHADSSLWQAQSNAPQPAAGSVHAPEQQPASTAPGSRPSTPPAGTQPSQEGSRAAAEPEPPQAAPVTKPVRAPWAWHWGLGMGVPMPLGGSDLNTSKRISLATHAEAVLSARWSFQLGMQYSRYQYEQNDEFDPRLLIPMPVLPGDEYRFRYVEGKMKYLMPSVALQYRFRYSASLAGYLGLGYAPRIMLADEAEYEFTHTDNGVEHHYELPLRLPHRWRVGMAQAGVSYSLPNQRALLFAELASSVDWGSSGQRAFSMLLTQLGLRWRIR